MSVGFLVVRLQYRFYVFGHLSKLFNFSQFLVICLSLWCHPLHLLPTVSVLPKAGRFSTTVDLKN